MRLYLARHGEAGTAASDQERPLTAQGRADTVAVCKAASAAFPVPLGMILTSPLLRARQTADIALQTIPCAVAGYEVTELLRPDAPVLDLMAAMDQCRHWPVLLVGHQPFMGNLLSWLTGDECLRHGVSTSSLHAVDLIAFARDCGTLAWSRQP